MLWLISFLMFLVKTKFYSNMQLCTHVAKLNNLFPRKKRKCNRGMRNIVKSDKMLHAMRMNEAELNYFCRIYFKERRADMLKITESFKMSLTAYLRIFWRENMMRFMPLLKLVTRKLFRRKIISKILIQDLESSDPNHQFLFEKYLI